jgi:hypothetical protein
MAVSLFVFEIFIIILTIAAKVYIARKYSGPLGAQGI